MLRDVTFISIFFRIPSTGNGMFFTDSLSWETTSAHNTMKKKTLGSFSIFESLVQQTLFQLAKFRFCDLKKKLNPLHNPFAS